MICASNRWYALGLQVYCYWTLVHAFIGLANSIFYNDHFSYISEIYPQIVTHFILAGKGTLIELLQKSFPSNKFGFSVSHTTRKPREGEENGVHYNFSTVDAMKAEIDAGKFVEYAEVHGNYYGTR